MKRKRILTAITIAAMVLATYLLWPPRAAARALFAARYTAWADPGAWTAPAVEFDVEVMGTE